MQIPRDNEAEMAVVAGCIISRHCWPAASKHMTLDDFYDPHLARIAVAAASVDCAGLDRRAAIIEHLAAEQNDGDAAALDRDLAELEARAVATWSIEPWAIRVADAAERRRALAALYEAYVALGSGESMQVAAALLADTWGRWLAASANETEAA